MHRLDISDALSLRDVTALIVCRMTWTPSWRWREPVGRTRPWTTYLWPCSATLTTRYVHIMPFMSGVLCLGFIFNATMKRVGDA